MVQQQVAAHDPWRLVTAAKVQQCRWRHVVLLSAVFVFPADSAAVRHVLSWF
jgi:hypothetical protein